MSLRPGLALLLAVTFVGVGSAEDRLPRVWTTLCGVRSAADFDTVAEDLVAHGVEVASAPDHLGLEDRRKVLQTCRRTGLRLHTQVNDASRNFSNPLHGELAVMIGGAYRGLAIDRHLFSFSAARHRIVVEPPVYSVRQCYLKHQHYIMAGDGHYFGLYRPTGRAEIIVPEKLYDGRQHLRIVPAAIRRAPKGTVPENDTAAGLEPTEWIRDRYLVELEFDLTGLEDCRLDKVGIAVYWQMDVFDPRFRPNRGCYSVFSGRTYGKQADAAKSRIESWKSANGGAFPTDVIIAARIGDEIFNHAGFADGPAASFPIWGFSESGVAALERAMRPGDTYPRQVGFPEVYGEAAGARYLHAYHQAAAHCARMAVREFHKVGVKCFRNTTRAGAWAYVNDHDGTGQELLAKEFDILHLDPYPVFGNRYNEDVIPFDVQYMKGLARRCQKPVLLWMQAHRFGSGGNTHPTPEQIRRMYAQVRELKPDAIMWLGYDRHVDPFVSMTFPLAVPESWEAAADVNADFKALAPDARRRADTAIVRTYEERAKANGLAKHDESLADRRLYREATRLAKEGRAYDVFELPLDCPADKVDFSHYKEVIR